MVTKDWGLLESHQTYLQFLMLQDFLARFVLEIGASLWNTEKRTSILTNGQRNLFIKMEGCIGFEITYWKLMQYCKLYRRITKVPIHVFYMKLRKITEIAKISFAYLCKCAMNKYIFSASLQFSQLHKDWKDFDWCVIFTSDVVAWLIPLRPKLTKMSPVIPFF